MNRLKFLLGRFLWIKWHSTICHHTYWKRTSHGLVFKHGSKGSWLYRLQLPVCRKLDDWDHSSVY